MRDPARIDRILKLLEQRWKEQPDQRLGQLVCNFTAPVLGDVFVIEDERLEASLARGWKQFKARAILDRVPDVPEEARDAYDLAPTLLGAGPDRGPNGEEP